MPVDGHFTPRQREIYNIVLGAQRAAAAAFVAGKSQINDPLHKEADSLDEVAYNYINTHGKDLHGKPLGQYFIHGLGHSVGIDVHDPMDYPGTHLDKGMVVARLDAPALRDLPVVNLKEPWGTRRFVAACGYFALEELTLQKGAAFQGRRSAVEVLSVLVGSGRVETSAGWMGFRTGDTWLIPPKSAEYRLMPREKTRMLKFYVPDVERDFRQSLLKRGVRASKIERITFA
jgi:hypothetical protein